MDVTRLRRLLREVDDEHRDTMQTVTDELTSAAHAASRRAFLGGSLAIGGAAAAVFGPLAGAAAAADATTTTTAAPKQPQAADLPLLAFAQSLELAAVQVYVAAAATGKLAPGVVAVATTFGRHHREHAQAIAGLAGKAATGVANPKLVKEYGAKVAAAKSQDDLLTIAFQLETAAASTYAYALTAILGTNPAATIASIQPIEARHAVVLGQALGRPLIDLAPSFESNALRDAIDPTKYPVQG